LNGLDGFAGMGQAALLAQSELQQGARHAHHDAMDTA